MSEQWLAEHRASRSRWTAAAGWRAMVHGSSRPPHTAASPTGNQPGWRGATCPLCREPAAVTRPAIEAGGDWWCPRCGQHWDAGRLAAVAEYAAWVADHDRVVW